MNQIALVALNARYTHSSLGLRYLLANLEELREYAYILEFVINENINDIAERILKGNPSIVGIGVYIWNARDVQELVTVIKKVSPGTVIVLGGPEVSHLPMRMDFSLADYILQGEGEFEFYSLCRKILSGVKHDERIIKCVYNDTSKLKLPYQFYTDEDIKNRVIYVEASRGCPFTCEFCLSSIDKTVRYFDIQTILSELETLWNRGVRKFKFIDRTFNINIDYAEQILDYFLNKRPPYFIHFEVIPDNFPDRIKEKLKLFPPASLQLEVGIQTLNETTAANISRKLDVEKITRNLEFLSSQTSIHIHADLIIGLPGESSEEFARNLNLLTTLTSSEIQLGILKKLSGTAISRHDVQYGMVYSDTPPYEILQTNLIPFDEMQKLRRFSRFWDITYNSGNFQSTVRLLWNDGDVFKGFYDFSEWIYSQTASTWQISMERMAELLFKYLTDISGHDRDATARILIQDLLRFSGRRLPAFLREFHIPQGDISQSKLETLNRRQMKHLGSFEF